ncbi:MAG: GxxExxY protein [Candidatus Electryonea clarkiae]|nr:GxxExxY protein [Candidatus Electryonea clarkiae]
MQINEITEIIIGCAYKVHNLLGSGFLEKVYENALIIELEEAGLRVKQQYPISVYYKEQQVGDYFADLVVENLVIIELKAIEKLAKAHEVQLVHYLTATDIDNGLLINFSSSVEVKRKYRQYKPKKRIV